MSWGRKGLHRPVMGYLYLLLRFTCVIINLGTLLVHLITAAIIRSRSGRSLGAFRQSNALSDVGVSPDRRVLSGVGVSPERRILSDVGVSPDTRVLSDVGVSPDRRVLSDVGVSPDRRVLPHCFMVFREFYVMPKQ